MAYAWTLFRSGRADSAVAHGRRALALEPLSPGLRHSLVALAIGARRYDLALREVRPTGGAGADPVSAVLEAYAQLLSGRAAQCADHDLGPWVALRAMCLQEVGRAAEAKSLADTAPQVYPNPFQSTLQVELKDSQVLESVQLLDARGTMVQGIKVQKDGPRGQILAPATVPAGLYLLQLTTKEGKTTFHKIVKH